MPLGFLDVFLSRKENLIFFVSLALFSRSVPVETYLVLHYMKLRRMIIPIIILLLLHSYLFVMHSLA